ncbi:hypothetical protein HPB47_001508 [Ixodes persulcatus]|uniref:Uncharacterized protein n=1 Tax=Ixodes persulcatus TaxID=34615 RepID=A0AC60PQN1_IXOPE|nr:hypothetical protein HPB47_001508 [Ixodes persulcatus]
MFPPTYVRNDLPIQALSSQGKVREITQATYRSIPTVNTGTRHVRTKMKEPDPVPNFFPVGGHRATFDYPGIKRVCRHRRLEGRLRVNCTTEHCDLCAVFGHATDGCTSDCRRCSVSTQMRPDWSAHSPNQAPSLRRHGGLPGRAVRGLPLPAPLPDAAGASSPETQPVAPAPSLSAGSSYTPWIKVTEDPEASSDSERLDIMKEESRVAEDPSLSSLGAPSISVAPMVAGNKDSTHSSEPSDPSENKDPTNTRRV